MTQSGAGAKHASCQLAASRGWLHGPLSGGVLVQHHAAVGLSRCLPLEMGTEHYLYDLPRQPTSFRIRAINIFNVSGLWSPYFNIVTRGLVAIPHGPHGFQGPAPQWPPAPDLGQVARYRRHQRRANLDQMDPGPGEPAMGTRQHGPPAERAGHRSHHLPEGRDLYGQNSDSAGNASAGFAAWPLQSVDQPGWQTVIHTNEAPTFPGVKTNVVVSSSTLQLATGGPGAFVDAWADVDAIADWDGEGATAPSGMFQNSIP